MELVQRFMVTHLLTYNGRVTRYRKGGKDAVGRGIIKEEDQAK